MLLSHIRRSHMLGPAFVQWPNNAIRDTGSFCLCSTTLNVGFHSQIIASRLQDGCCSSRHCIYGSRRRKEWEEEGMGEERVVPVSEKENFLRSPSRFLSMSIHQNCHVAILSFK